MGYDTVRQTDNGRYDLDELVDRLKPSLFIANIFGLILALVNFSICVWVRFDLDFWEWVNEIQWYTYWNCMYVVMIAMLLHVGNALLSIYATWFSYPRLLLTSMVLRFLIWWVTLTGAVLICIYGVEESNVLVSDLNEVFMGLIYRWDTDARAARVMTQIQEYVGCCGAGGNRDDYVNNKKGVPDSCRHPITGNCYGTGCGQKLAFWLEPWTCTMAAVSVLFCASDPFLIYLSNSLRNLL